MAKKKKSTEKQMKMSNREATELVLKESEVALYEIRKNAKSERCSHECGYEMLFEDLTDAEITGALKMVTRAF